MRERVYRHGKRWKASNIPGEYQTQPQALSMAMLALEVDRLTALLVEAKAQLWIAEKRSCDAQIAAADFEARVTARVESITAELIERTVQAEKIADESRRTAQAANQEKERMIDLVCKATKNL